MVINNLWDNLQPRPETLNILKKDLSEGKVPELPFFIIDQEEVKTTLTRKLADIDGDRMQTNLIIAQYGNGKTNLLKYLQLFFELDSGIIKVVYSRADVEQPDLILFLLRLIQDRFTDTLITSIIELRSQNNIIDSLANNFEDNFSSIREYAKTLFSPQYEKDDLRKIITSERGK